MDMISVKPHYFPHFNLNISHLTPSILADMTMAHHKLLKLTMCLLQHLAKHSDVTDMDASNLAKCITPSLFMTLNQW